ncbi:MAG: TolC family protein [Bacteroidetes bacterium]|nr:TolC family protein [Bacteroidota bacterium]
MNRLLLLLLLFASSASAQHHFSVAEAQAHGLQYNTEIKNARLDVKLAKKQVMETVAIGLPHVSAEAQWQHFLEVPTTVMPANAINPNASADDLVEMQFGMAQNASATLTASQLLFDGAYIVGLRASAVFKQFSEQVMFLTERQVKDSIAVAYYNVLVAEENKKFLSHLAEVHEHILGEIQMRYEMGFVEDLDVDRMALVLSNMESQSENMNRTTAIANLYLKLMLGIPLNESLVLSDSLDGLVQSSSEIQLEEGVWSNRLEYQLAEMQVRLNRLDVRRYQSGWLPSIAAFGSYSQNAMRQEFNFTADGNWYPTKMVGIKATLNIFDGLSGTAKTQQARINLEKSINQQAFVEESLQLELEVGQSAYFTAVKEYQHKETNLNLAQKIYEKTLAKYKEGLISSLELSQAGADYLQAHSEFSLSMKNLLLAKLKYQRTLGK